MGFLIERGSTCFHKAKEPVYTAEKIDNTKMTKSASYKSMSTSGRASSYSDDFTDMFGDFYDPVFPDIFCIGDVGTTTKVYVLTKSATDAYNVDLLNTSTNELTRLTEVITADASFDMDYMESIFTLRTEVTDFSTSILNTDNMYFFKLTVVAENDAESQSFPGGMGYSIATSDTYRDGISESRTGKYFPKNADDCDDTFDPSLCVADTGAKIGASYVSEHDLQNANIQLDSAEKHNGSQNMAVVSVPYNAVSPVKQNRQSKNKSVAKSSYSISISGSDYTTARTITASEKNMMKSYVNNDTEGVIPLHAYQVDVPSTIVGAAQSAKNERYNEVVHVDLAFIEEN